MNIKHSLFPYQERDMNKVCEAIQNTRKLLFVAHTSYGKTFAFCTVAKWFNHNYNKKILILCHREELVNQAADTCIKLGLTVEKILPSTKRLHGLADVYIAMEMTLFNRIKKDAYYIDIGLVIIDEAHSQLFLKHIDFFKTQKILGFTATPIINEKLTYYKCDRCKNTSSFESTCCNMEMIEWSKPKTMSLFYDDIVVGANINELIECGQVVRDFNICAENKDLQLLKIDHTGDFSTQSQNEAFANGSFNVKKNYEQYCLGKKTMIFNPSAKINKQIYEDFKASGYNIKIYDSVNETELNRKALVQWFNDTDDAILCNVSVFTTGFDSREVQAIILNRATLSLSLFLQIAGRGARSTTKIYKDHFILIDGGGNVDRFGKWSDPNRDWEDIFWNGIGKDTAKKENIMMVQECPECGFLFPRTQATCDNCNHTIPPPKKKEETVSESILTPIDDIPLPDGKKIKEYTLRRGEDIHFAFKILSSQILDLFRFYGVSKDLYSRAKASGKLQKRIGELIRPSYFTFINSPEFKNDSNRSLNQVIKKISEKIDKYYIH